MRVRSMGTAAVLALIAGCTVGPNYQPPRAALPATYDTPSAATASATSQAATQPAAIDPARWWRALNDPELESLVERAVKSNLDLEMALQRLQAARAQEFVVSGGTLPFLEASGAAARGSGNNSTKGRISAPLNAGANTSGLHEITDVIGFDAGWEIDLFGRFRRQLEASAADTQAVAEARNSVLISLIADVARVYFEMRTAQARLAIAQQSVTVSQQTLDVVQQRFDRGLTNELDVALARRQTASQQASLAPLADEIVEDQRHLAVLLGLSPEQLRGELQGTAPLPALPADIAAGVPLDLLRRRPDIRQAERRLAAENARIGVATADLFPRVALTAGLGMQEQGLGRNPSVDSLIWSMGPTAIVPLLDFGRIDSMIMLEDYRTRELFYGYQRMVLGAVAEVDDSLGRYASERERLDDLGRAVEASNRAVDLASGRYERGLIDFLNVLDAQRQLFNLQDQYTVAQEAEVVEFIAVYKALGGGWENYQAVPPLRNPRPAIIEAGEQVLAPAKSPIVQDPSTVK